MMASLYYGPQFPRSRRANDPTAKFLPKGQGNCSGCGKVFKLKGGNIPKHYNKFGRRCWTISPFNNDTSLPVK